MESVKRRLVKVIDSHTGGEPTRVVVSGGPELGGGSMAARLEKLRAEHDRFRSAVVNEPRGSDVYVGALLCEPSDRSCAAGVILFDKVGYLGMCGHGTVWTARTSCCARARATIARRAAREPAQRWPACTPMASSGKGRSGARRVSWAASSKEASPLLTARFIPASRVQHL